MHTALGEHWEFFCYGLFSLIGRNCVYVFVWLIFYWSFLLSIKLFVQFCWTGNTHISCTELHIPLHSFLKEKIARKSIIISPFPISCSSSHSSIHSAHLTSIFLRHPFLSCMNWKIRAHTPRWLPSGASSKMKHFRLQQRHTSIKLKVICKIPLAIQFNFMPSEKAIWRTEQINS